MKARPGVNSAGRHKLLIVYGVTAVIAVFAYWFALGSQHIPTSTDELTYVHITRVTAASGHLLPLRAEIAALVNLKPPPLFWQGIASTNWGKNSSLWHFRYPNVVYTLLTGCLVFLLGRKLSGQVETGLLASLVFLAFFSTYRYRRSFLTDPPLVFWLFLPFFVMLYWQPASFESRVFIPVVLGIFVGIAVFYKSLALLVPVLGALAWWFWHKREYQFSTFAVRDAWKLAVIGCIALTIFALWFVLDPDPGAIWKDFMLRENVSKLQFHQAGYLRTLLWSSESVWKMVPAYPVNAGLLGFAVLALFYVAYQSRSSLAEGEKLLWMCVLSYFLVFTVPSHRSERYLLPAMPALAILTALSWHRLHRNVFVATIALAGVLIGALIYVSICLQQSVAPAKCYPALYWVGLGATELLVVAVLFLPTLLRSSVLVVVFLLYLCFSGFMRPLDGPIGSYGADVRQAVRGRELWVPSRSNAREEGYRFQLPGADIHSYNYESRPSVGDLSAKYSLFVVRLPLNDSQPIPGKVLGQRLDLGSNHSPKKIVEMATGQVIDHLFVKELLIEADPSSHQLD